MSVFEIQVRYMSMEVLATGTGEGVCGYMHQAAFREGGGSGDEAGRAFQ